MPLHLLGKKSWNVYNADNIARVRRDEAAAQAAEEAEEQRMREFDSERRLAILRGEIPPPTPADDEAPAKIEHPRGSLRKPRKRAGEDDTDYELRLAKEKKDERHGRSLEYEHRQTAKTSSAPIVDHAGHIDLFGDERARAARAGKNEEAEAEARQKRREFEDQYTMRFSNAAGRDGTVKPWYSHSDGVAPDASAKNVWGRDDPKRKQRDAQRIASDDPLAMMKKGASQMRELKKERRRVQEERDEELRQLRRETHRHDRHADSTRRHRDRRKHKEESRRHREPRCRSPG